MKLYWAQTFISKAYPAYASSKLTELRPCNAVPYIFYFSFLAAEPSSPLTQMSQTILLLLLLHHNVNSQFSTMENLKSFFLRNGLRSPNQTEQGRLAPAISSSSCILHYRTAFSNLCREKIENIARVQNCISTLQFEGLLYSASGTDSLAAEKNQA